VQSNHVDEAATRTFDLGPCRCPVDPKPHVNDSAELVSRFGIDAKGRIRHAGRQFGVEAGFQVAILLGVKSWTLVRPDGSARPITAEEVARLDEATVTGIDALGVAGLMQGLGPLMEPDDPLPNPSGAPSSAGRSESASPTQTTPTPATSTST
jgi:hypothetical protein